MVWSLADERFQENLAAARAYFEEHWTLCAPRTAASQRAAWFAGRPLQGLRGPLQPERRQLLEFVSIAPSPSTV
ncbi:helicase associated domain-containing protein [Streptomyces atratus]|uniref:helicase associated domain-containing protein n=1 Tax=Streptomyces TaxID=1883 RepID=UPI0037B001E4